MSQQNSSPKEVAGILLGSSTSLESQLLASTTSTPISEIKDTSSLMSESDSGTARMVARTDIHNSVSKVAVSLANAQNVPDDQIPTVKTWQQGMLQHGMAIDAQFQGPNAKVDKYHARVATLESSVSTVESKTESKSSATLLPSSNQSAAGFTPALNTTWYFSGENSLRTLTFQVGTRTWQEDFVRLRLPAQTLLLTEKNLKPQAHQVLYGRLSSLLAPVTREAAGKRVVLSGGPGLGKSYCAQHYLYHQAPGQHQIVAWLSGTSNETFEQDWHRLAEQFRAIEGGLKRMDDDTAIRTWCEERLGQWLLVLDDVNIDPAKLEKHLPRKGGHVLLTTRHPNYAFSGAEHLRFSPLDQADSERLVKAYFGRYWSVTGHAEEESAFKRLLAAMSGYPIALTQAALLINKKELSFQRFMAQFQDPTTRPYLLQDTVFSELHPKQTVSYCWVNAKQQLLDLLKEVLSAVTSSVWEADLIHFITALVQAAESLILPNNSVAIVTQEHLAQYGWLSQFSPDQQKHVLAAYQTYLPAYLPISFDNVSCTWQVTPVGLSVLQSQTLAITPAPVSSSSQPTLEQKALHSEVQEDKGEKKEAKREVFDTLDQASLLPAKRESLLETTPKPVEMKLSFRDRAQVEHIQTDLYTENSQQRQEKLKQGWKLPRPNPNFISREKLTQALVEKLPVEIKESKTQQVLLTTAVTGMGGVGKTELARDFITRRSESQRYRYRFWLEASTATQLLSEFRQLALYLQLIEREPFIPDAEMLQHVKKWFSIHRGWLLVLDNADQYHEIASFIPEVGGAVLVTTRNNHPGTLPPERLVPVSVLEPEEAFHWLCQLADRQVETLPETERAAAERLVAKLGYLPLAIAQAAAYLRANPTITIANYLERFSALLSDETLAREAKSEDARARLVVSNTWQLSLQEIAKHVAYPELIQGLLNTCAYLAAKDIPLFVLAQWLKDARQDQPQEPNLLNYWLDEYVGQLLRYSLVERNSQTAAVSFHCLIQQVVREKSSTAEQAKQLKQTMDLLVATYPQEDKGVSKQWDVIRFGLVPHLESVVTYHDQQKQKEEGEFAFTLGLLASAYRDLGNSAEQRRLLGRARVVFESYFGPHHWKTSTVLVNLANAHGAWGDSHEQRQLLERALKIDESHYGPDHWQTASTLVSLANTHGALGNPHEQRQLLERALKIDESHYGPNHWQTAITLNNLANALGELGKTHEKRQLLERALKIQESHYGRDHWKTASTLNNLAIAVGQLGETQEQRRLLERALKIDESHYGPNHWQTAVTLSDLASALGELGETHEKCQLLERALKIQENHYGRDHWKTASTLADLAIALGQLGKTQEKHQLLERALKINESRYGRDHWKTASILANVANALGELGKTKEKHQLLERVLKIQESHYGRDHWKTASTLADLAIALGELGETQEKRQLLERALKIQESHYGRDHWQTAVMLTNLANVLGELGNTQEKRQLLERALKIQESHYGSDHWQTASTLVNLASVLGELGNVQEKRRLLERALKIKENHYGPDHWQIASTLANLANAYGAVGDLHEQRRLLERALKINESRYGAGHWQTAVLCLNLAIVLGALREHRMALPWAEKAAAIFTQHYGRDHAKTQKALNVLTKTKIYIRLGGPKTERKSTGLTDDKTSPPVLSGAGVDFNAIENLKQAAEAALGKGDIDKAIATYEELLKLALPSFFKGSALHNLACVYHIQSHQKHSEQAWLQAQKTFEAAIPIKPETNTYCEYAQFLYLKGIAQQNKPLIIKAIELLTQALSAKREGGLSYGWVERETLPTCLRSLLTHEGTTIVVSPSLLTRYLLVSCYCYLNKLPEAQAALEELEKRARVQPTDVVKCLLLTAQSEYAACEKLSIPSASGGKEKSENEKETQLSTLLLGSVSPTQAIAETKGSLATSVSAVASRQGPGVFQITSISVSSNVANQSSLMDAVPATPIIPVPKPSNTPVGE